MNERERLIKQGFNVVAAMCLVMIGARILSTIQLAMMGMLGSVATIVPLLVTLWLAWNLYSGKIWIRNIVALYGIYMIIQSLFLLFGGALIGEPLFMLFQIINIAVYGGLIYLLFMYEPVQEYFRYVGGETI